MEPIDRKMSEAGPSIHAAGNAPADEKNPTGFFTFPLEIRQMIYRFAVPNGYVFDVREQPTFKAQSIVCGSPGALINRPPLDIMCDAHDFLVPVDTWAYEQDPPAQQDDETDVKHPSDPESNEDDSGDDDEHDATCRDCLEKEDDLAHMEGIAVDTYVDASEPTPIFLRTIQSLVVTSRQTREEVLDILYGENVFRVPVGKYSAERALRHGFHRSLAFRIKHIMLVYEPISPSGPRPELNLDRQMWNKILPNLASLRLVLTQPIAEHFIHRMYCRRSMADMRKAWAEELPPALAYLAKKLASTADIQVDCDNWKVASKIINKSLGRDWQHVRTTTGDQLFQRPNSYHKNFKWTDKDFDDAPSECSCHPYEAYSNLDSDGNTIDGYNDDDEDEWASDDEPSSSDDTPPTTRQAISKGKGKATATVTADADKTPNSVNGFFGDDYPSIARVLTEAGCKASMQPLREKLEKEGPLSKLATTLGTVFETLDSEIATFWRDRDEMIDVDRDMREKVKKLKNEKAKLERQNDEQDGMIAGLYDEIAGQEEDKAKLRKVIDTLRKEKAALHAEVKDLKAARLLVEQTTGEKSADIEATDGKATKKKSKKKKKTTKKQGAEEAADGKSAKEKPAEEPATENKTKEGTAMEVGGPSGTN